MLWSNPGAFSNVFIVLSSWHVFIIRKMCGEDGLEARNSVEMCFPECHLRSVSEEAALQLDSRA